MSNETTSRWGASAAEWAHFRALSEQDCLPVVSDPGAQIHPVSNMKDLGKTPSRFHEGKVVGISKWTEMQSTKAQVDAWTREPDYGIAFQTRRFRAIDIDTDDQAEADSLQATAEAVLGRLQWRTRAGSPRRLALVDVPGEVSKVVVKTKHGMVEFLATGQQCIVAGTHPKGQRYTWAGGLPVPPKMSVLEFEALRDLVAMEHGVAGAVTARAALSVGARSAADVADPDVAWLEAKGWVTDWAGDGRVDVRCPWEAEHTSDTGTSSTSYYPAGVGGQSLAGFKCLHAHCASRGIFDFRRAVGLDNPADDFEVVEAVAAATVPGEAKAASEPRRGVPEAQRLTTDQANAGRLVNRFGKRLMVVGDEWYAWTGARWEKRRKEVYEYAQRLSKAIDAEADAWEAKKSDDEEQQKINEATVKALRGWAKQSEMRSSIESAVALAKHVLTVDASKVDADPWALNCINGTVDLRTGALREHNPNDLITRLAPVRYDPAATAAHWEQVVLRVTREEGREAAPVASFLRRWFGYCCTGSTREQAFVVHYGQGSNGKSTILDTIGGVLGDYAGTAAPGLMVSSGKDRHPTEIADLFGRRMMTAHESGEGGVLREDFIKQATGGDKLKARFMRADFFEFLPTHKLQLLTNHKPTIKGQDHGIWRRVLLVPYEARWGTAEEVDAGAAQHVKDTRILEHILAEREGVLAWMVRGAVEWYRSGLAAPDTVLAASRDYKAEQDRVSQFVESCCEVGPGFEAELTGTFGGLYDAYRGWCNESGTYPLAKNRLIGELERVVPTLKREVRRLREGAEKRKDRAFVVGLRLVGG